jgi:hypothetical protein
LQSWDQDLLDEELKETKSSIAPIQVLQAEEDKELSILEIMTHFIWLCLQPLQARTSQMWSYPCMKDNSRITDQDWPEGEFEKLVRRLTKLMKDDPIPLSCCVAAFDAMNTPPKVSYFDLLSSLCSRNISFAFLHLTCTFLGCRTMYSFLLFLHYLKGEDIPEIPALESEAP